MAGFESAAQINDAVPGMASLGENLPLHTPSRSLGSVRNYLVLEDGNE